MLVKIAVRLGRARNYVYFCQKSETPTAMRTFATTLLALLLLHASATQYITVNDIHYRIDETAKTATVVCRQHASQTSPDNGWSYYYYQAYQEIYGTNGPSDLYVGDVVIPATFDYDGATYTVTAAGNNVFCGSELMTSLTIPATLVTLGDGTFSLCNALSSIVVDAANPKFVSQDGIMYERSPLAIFLVPRALDGNIILPNGLTEINGFAYNSGIASVTLPNSAVTIKDGAFQKCSALAEVNFGTGLKTIERNAFTNCVYLQIANFQNTQLESIGANAFDGCSDLSLLYLGKSLKTIGRSAFENTALFALELPTTLQSIDDYAFRGCTSLATILNRSALDIVAGATTHGMVGYYATNIIDGRTPTALEHETAQPQIAVHGRQISIAQTNGAPLTIYNANGAIVSNEKLVENQTITLPNAGIYLVKIGNHTHKIAVN